jgi:hypothetical protein
MQRRNIRFDDWACTFTFCECAENGVGMEQLGALGGRGLTEADLRAAAAACEQAGIACELIDLVAAAGVDAGSYEPAFVLVMRRALPVLLAGAAAAVGAVAADAAAAAAAAPTAAANAATDADAAAAATAAATAALVDEHRAIAAVVDKKALFRGEVKNKNARWNLCFADYQQEPEYAAGRGRVIDFADVPLLSAVRAGIGRFFGAPYARLFAEGNYYYDVARTGIGFHGDAERRVVIALRLGAPIPLHYQWYSRHQPVGARVVLHLNSGDMYAMSEKAVGTDWKRSAIPTLRHAAGGPAYTK